MIYRYSISLDPRLRRTSMIGLVLFALLVLGALVSALRGAPIVGFAIIAGTALIGWKVRGFVKSHLNTWIQTTDEAIVFRTPSGERVRIPWPELTHAGSIYTPNGEKFLYCYSTTHDRFVCIPPSFENLEELYEELESHVELEDITMSDKESAGDAIRRNFAEESTNDDEPKEG